MSLIYTITRSFLRICAAVTLCVCLMDCNTVDPVEFFNIKSLRVHSNLIASTEGKPGIDYRFEAVHNHVTIPIVYEWNFDDPGRITIKDSAAIHHTFQNNGLYAVLVRILHGDTGEELARSTLVVNIRDTVPTIEMTRIEPGSYLMGSNRGIDQSEQPAHLVSITRPLLVSTYELRQSEWNAIMPTSSSWFQDDSLPAESMSWFEAVDFCNRLSVRSGLTPAYSISGDSVQCLFSTNGYRLPTEAEWEYFARAGTLTSFYSGSEAKPYADCLTGDSLEDVIDQIAWYCMNSDGKTHRCGLKIPNAFKLYDVIGNVAEWTWDWFDGNFYKNQVSADPVNSKPSFSRVVRGGNAFSGTIDIRVSSRRLSRSASTKSYGIGMRLVRTLP